MHAINKATKSPIVATVESIYGHASLVEDGFERNLARGGIKHTHSDGGTKMFWDTSKTVTENDQVLYVDDDDNEVPADHSGTGRRAAAAAALRTDRGLPHRHRDKSRGNDADGPRTMAQRRVHGSQQPPQQRRTAKPRWRTRCAGWSKTTGGRCCSRKGARRSSDCWSEWRTAGSTRRRGGTIRAGAAPLPNAERYENSQEHWRPR